MRLSRDPPWKKRTLVWTAAVEVALASAFHFGTAEDLVKLVYFDVVYA